MHSQHLWTRLIGMAVAVVMTALLVGGQLGIAGHYAVQADEALAAARAPVVAQAAASAVQHRASSV